MVPTIEDATVEAFKNALGSFASGVTVITVHNSEGAPCGMTASAFNSVSLDPLSILVCLNRESRTYQDVCRRGRFGVNILGQSAKPIAAHCAKPGEDKYLEAEWLESVESADQPPVLSDAMAYLDCEVISEMPAGTHSVVLAKVKAVGVGCAESEPLVYFRGDFRELISEPVRV